jgi:hypothetical protein
MQPKPITRRTFIKTLSAGAGASTIIAFMPSHWLKPVVRTGVLPVHAATSAACYTLSAQLFQASFSLTSVTLYSGLLDPAPTGITGKTLVSMSAVFNGDLVVTTIEGSASVTDNTGALTFSLDGIARINFTGTVQPTSQITVTFTLNGTCWAVTLPFVLN